MRLGRKRTALFAGSFDPVHLGHIDIIKRGLRLFDELTLAVAVNDQKPGLFSMEDRLKLLQDSLNEAGITGDIKYASFSEMLAVDFARRNSLGYFLRALRNAQDLAYEAPMAELNGRMVGYECETVFLLARPEFAVFSSTRIREIRRLGGDPSFMVTKAVNEALCAGD